MATKKPWNTLPKCRRNRGMFGILIILTVAMVANFWNGYSSLLPAVSKMISVGKIGCKAEDPGGTITNVTESVSKKLQRFQFQGVTLGLKGGIGNQLWQYACSYALARDMGNKPLLIHLNPDLNRLKGRKFLPRERDFVLDKFTIPELKTVDQKSKYNIIGVGDRQLLFGSFASNKAGYLQLDGGSYCQTEKYWLKYKDEIVSFFRLKPEVIEEFPPHVKSIGKKIENVDESVAVHVRRGDFFYSRGFDLPISFQRTAIRRMIQILQARGRNNTLLRSLTFFVFSDDIQYAREKLVDLAREYRYEFVFVSYKSGNTTSLQDFFLITKCKHFIFANSTFGWWAAYLSLQWGKGQEERSLSDRVVITSAFNPTFWQLWSHGTSRSFYKMLHGRLYHPKDWIIIDPFAGER